MGLPIFGVIALTLSASLTLSMAHAEVGMNAAQEQTARLRVGDMLHLDGSAAALTFKAVTRDSRCPKDVRCIRAGEAVVVLALRDRSAETSTLTFDVPPPSSTLKGQGAMASRRASKRFCTGWVCKIRRALCPSKN